MTAPSATLLTFATGSWSGTYEYRHDTAQNLLISNGDSTDSVFYDLHEIADGGKIANHGVEFRYESGVTKVYATTDGTINTNNPSHVSVSGWNNAATSVTISNGDTLEGFGSGGSFKYGFAITSSMLWSTGGGTSSESTSTAVASLGTSSGGVLKMFIPASSTGGSYSVFEGSTLKQVTTHAVTVADLVPITSWSMGNSSIWHVYFNGSIINTWPAVFPSTSTTKKVHCNFW